MLSMGIPSRMAAAVNRVTLYRALGGDDSLGS